MTTCPWPEAQERRRKALARVGKTWTYYQCTGCKRWTGAEHALGTEAPTLCDWVCNPPKRNTSGLAAARRVRGLTGAVAFFALATAAWAEDAPKAPQNAAQSEPALSRYCAREGEAIEERIARLETALRLAKAEMAVNRKRRK